MLLEGYGIFPANIKKTNKFAATKEFFAMPESIIWGMFELVYAAFWTWYVGLKGELPETEVEQYIKRFKATDWPAADKLENLHHFLVSDDGRE